MHLPTFTMTLRRSLAGALVVSTLSACAVVGGGPASGTAATPAPIPRVVQRDLGPQAESAPASVPSTR